MKIMNAFNASAASLRKRLCATIVLTLLTSGTAMVAQANPSEMEITAPLEPIRPGVVASQLFAELAAQNARRSASLIEYSTTRTYEVKDVKGKTHAREIGVMQYRAPDKKTFAVKSEDGSGMVRRVALNPLIASEIDASSGKQHHDSSITPANYDLVLVGEQQVGSYHCFVAQAIPKRRDKYLFEGKVWIDAQDYAIVRIEGHPAKRPSFWIERADFIRQYQKVGGFWFPSRDQTFVRVKLYGTKILTIDHNDYEVNGVLQKQESIQAAKVF